MSILEADEIIGKSICKLTVQFNHKKSPSLLNLSFCLLMSGWQDSNLRPPHPKCGAIPGYATPRLQIFQKC